MATFRARVRLQDDTNCVHGAGTHCASAEETSWRRFSSSYICRARSVGNPVEAAANSALRA